VSEGSRHRSPGAASSAPGGSSHPGASGSGAVTVAGAEDQAGVRALLEAVGLPVIEVTDAALVVVARDRSGQIVGCAALEAYGATGLLRSVAVAPEARGCGLARSLVSAIESGARERDLEELVLLTLDAEAVFAALGYRTVPRSSISGPVLESWEFRHHGCDSARVMHRSLAPGSS